MALPTASDNLFPKVILDAQSSDPTAPSDRTWKLYSKAGGIYARSSNSVVGPFAAATGASSLTHAYVGYNTVGGTTENAVDKRQIMKQVVLASACVITSIGLYVKQNTAGRTTSLGVAVLTDNAGSPEQLIASTTHADSTLFLATNNGSAGAARWVHAPVGLYVAAGTYWIAAQMNIGSAGDYLVYYDGSGGDRYYANSTTAGRMSDSGWTAVTTSSNKYSLRASTIS